MVALLAPSFVTWWSGRRIVTRIDDPMLPELLLARRRQIGLVLSLSLIAMALGPRGHVFWAIPTMLLLFGLAAYPVRRAVFGETWSVWRYIWFGTRSFVATIGFWLLIAYIPSIALRTVPIERIDLVALVGGGLALVILLWQRWFVRIWLVLHSARRLDDPQLTERFARIAGRAGMSTPEAYAYGVPGMAAVNAFALPAIERPAVAFSRALLEALDANEIVAIFGHELAHLEEMNAKRCRVMRAATLTLALLAGLVAPLYAALHPATVPFVVAAFPFIVLIALALRGNRSQAREMASDRRAVELTGSPDAMVSALTKIHVVAQLPRRWPHDFERAASHPSLARRIQAIHARAGHPSATPIEVTVLQGAQPGVWLALDATHVHRFEGVRMNTPPELSALRDNARRYHATAYEELTELRVAPVRGGRVLHAVSRDGVTTTTPLAPESVAGAQRVLDLVDVKLAERVTDRAPVMARLVAAAIAVALLAAQVLGIGALAAVAALATPTAGTLAGLGAIAIAKAVVAIADGTYWWGTESVRAAIIGAAILGALAIRYGHVRVKSREGRREALLALAFVLIATIVGLTIALQPWLAEPSSGQPARRLLTVAYALLGAAALAMDYPGRVVRTTGKLVATATLVIVVAAVGPGAMARITPRLEVESRKPALQATVKLPEHPLDIELSPRATRYLAQVVSAGAGDDEDGPVAMHYRVGRFDGASRQVDATRAAFLDDDRLLLVVGSMEALRLQLTDAESGRVLWQLALPPIMSPTLSVDHAVGAWRLAGYERGGTTLVTFVGEGSTPKHRMRRWHRGEAVGPVIAVLRDGSVLATSIDVSTDQMSSLAALGGMSMRMRVRRIGERGADEIGAVDGMLACGAARHDAVTCTSFRDGQSLLWTVDPEDGVDLAGMLPPGFYHMRPGHTGALTAINSGVGEVLVVDAADGRGTRLPVATRGEIISAVAESAGRVGVMIRRAAGPSELRLYSTR